MKLVRLDTNTFREWRLNTPGVRERIRKEMLAEHGECQLRHANGTIVAVVRDPNRPKLVAPFGLTPPHQCICKQWAGTPEGRHHKICVERQKWEAWELEQQKVAAEEVVAFAEAAARAGGPQAPALPPAPEPAPPLPPTPEECVCNGWQPPPGWDGKGHHPICQHREAYDQLPRLVDLDTGKALRFAHDEEVVEAKAHADKTGAPLITIDGKQYAVEGLSLES